MKGNGRIIIPFLNLGHLQGEKCLYFCSHNSPSHIREQFQGEGIHLIPFEEKGQLEFFQLDDFCLQGERFQVQKMLTKLEGIAEKALSHGYHSIRATGEMDWILKNREDMNSFIQYEHLLNKYLNISLLSIPSAVFASTIATSSLQRS